MLNKVELIGRVGKDPETRYMPDGRCVVGFSVATSERWKDKVSGEQKEATEWHNITIFGALAEIAAKFLVKGSLVFLEGKIKTEKYEQSGVTKYSVKIVCDKMLMLSGKPEGDSGHGTRQQQAPTPERQQRQAAAPAPAQSGGFDDIDGDIPF